MATFKTISSDDIKETTSVLNQLVDLKLHHHSSKQFMIKIIRFKQQMNYLTQLWVYTMTVLL